METKKFSFFFEKDVIIRSFYGPRVIEGKPDSHNGADASTGERFNLRVPRRNNGIGAKYRVTLNQWIEYTCYLTNTKVKALFVRLLNLSDAEGFEWEFIHLSDCKVPVGTNMVSGSYLAKTGNSGCSTAPHTHITLRKKGIVVDPLPYLDTYTKNGVVYLKGGLYTPPQPPEETCDIKLQKANERIKELEGENSILRKAMSDSISILQSGICIDTKQL